MPLSWCSRVRRFAHGIGSCGEAEVPRLPCVLRLADEFRKDVAVGGIQQKFWEALTERGGGCGCS